MFVRRQETISPGPVEPTIGKRLVMYVVRSMVSIHLT
jgi:hypothetical protein